MPQISAIHHVAVTVTDLERSAAWYADLLGLQRLMEGTHPDGGGRLVLLGRPDLSFSVALHGHDTNEKEPFAESRTGLDHVSFLVSGRDELKAWEQELASRGIEHSPLNEQGGYAVVVFRDPDNIQLEMIAVGPA